MERKNGNFLTRLFTKQEQEQEQAPAPPDPSTIRTNAAFLPQTVLALNPMQEEQYPPQEKETLRTLVASLPPLPIGEINLVPIACGTTADGYFVRVFVRNGKEVDEDISLREITLSLFDATGDCVARGSFQVANFGLLKFGECRPWFFAWAGEDVFRKDADLTTYRVSFE